MVLRTLGGLSLQGSSFARQKPLLLLAYLALEGARDRRFLAELFWPDATDRLNRLSTALTRIRKPAAHAVASEGRRVWVAIDCDAQQLIDAAEAGDHERALSLYRGPFLEGAEPGELGEELEEWVWSTREYLAARVRGLILEQAERQAAQGEFEEAAFKAESAYRLPAAPVPEPEVLPRFHRLLLAGASPLASELRAEAEDFDVSVAQTIDEARRELSTAGSPAGSGYDHALGNLPAPSAPLVGRKRELEQLCALLTSEVHRLVTLLGPGGIGKTRLALEAASSCAGEFDNGAWFASLVGMRSEADFVTAIANGVDLQNRRGDLRENLERFLRSRSLLLFLDNFESALPHVEVLAGLLEASPGLRVLATSRDRLDLAAETVLVVDALPYPRGRQTPRVALAGRASPHSLPSPSVAEAAGSEAVQLLLQRARLVRPGGRFDDADLEQAARICRLVQGMPLAIVLAAGWLELLSFADVARELEHGLGILEGSHADLPERQRSVQAVCDYSWNRLGTQEQQVFARLSVFGEGFGRDAGREVASAGLASLRTLAHKSLLYARPNGRFAVHEVLRQFAAQKLAQSGEERVTIERHARYYLTLLASSLDDLRGPRQPESMRRLLDRYDNISLAWHRAASHGLTPLIENSLEALFELQLLSTRYLSGQRAFDEAASTLAGSGRHDRLLSRLRIRAAAFRALRGEFQEARSELSHELAAPLEPGEEALAREYLGHYVLYFLGELEEARKQLQEAGTRYQEVGDELGRGRAIYLSGALAWHRGDYRTAEELLRTGYDIFERLKNPYWLGLCTSGLGVVAYELRDLARSRQLLETALEELEGLEHKHNRANAQSNLGQILVDLGEVDTGVAQLEEGLRGLEEAGDPVLVAEAHFRLGQAHLLKGEADAARRCFLASLAVTRDYGFENAGLLLGFADLLRKTDSDFALALCIFVSKQDTVTFRERELAGGRIRDLSADGASLARASERASAMTFDRIAQELMTLN